MEFRRETIEEAFLEVVRVQARREEAKALREMKGMELYDPEVMRGAWR